MRTAFANQGRGVLLAAALLVPSLVAAAESTPANAAQASAPTELLLEVRVNGEDENQTALFLRFANGALMAGRSDLEHWRFKLPPAQSYAYQGSDFYPLSAIEGLQYKIDDATQTISITVSPAVLAGTVIGGLTSSAGPVQPSPLGGFLNYNLFATHASGTTTTDAYTELGLFDRWGVLTDTYLGNDLDGPAKQWIRLETTFTQDHPEDIASFRLGDSLTNGGMTGLAVRFGGLQWGTNFTTQPSLVTLPLPSISGSATGPSTLQLYVNGVLQHSQEVQPGPFIIPQVPVTSGPGTITLVVRDLNGQQQIVNLPYYGTPTLLAHGLDDYSFSFGKERQNFGVDSNDYGPSFGSAFFRRGFTDSFTGELRGDAAPGLQVAGAGTFFSMSTDGVVNLAAAESHSTVLGQGTLGQVGYQYTGNTFGAGLSVQRASPRFTQVGYLSGTTAPRNQATANLSAFMGAAGSLSLTYIHQTDPILGEIKLGTLNYTKSLGEAAFLSLSVFHDFTGQGGSGIFLSLTLPLGPQRNASVGASHQGGTTIPFAQFQQSLPAGTGFGYRLTQQFGPVGSTDGELDYQNNVGTYDVEALHLGGQNIYSAGVNGGLGFVGGELFASRQLTDSFAVVEVPDQPDVDVYAQNQVVARTDSNGYAVIPRLNAYQDNVIGYDPRNLTLDTDITTSTLNVVPGYRSGLFVQFPVKRVRGVTFTVQLPNGKPLPAGAEIEVPGRSDTFPVGYDGETYVTDLPSSVRLKATWLDQSCEFDVTVPSDSKEPLPDLGVFTCEAKKP